MPQTYWLDLFTVETWKEFLDHGGNVSGFSERRWATVQKIKLGDYLLCYLTRVSRWVGLLEVVGKPSLMKSRSGAPRSIPAVSRFACCWPWSPSMAFRYWGCAKN
jgi:hypothetical protein